MLLYLLLRTLKTITKNGKIKSTGGDTLRKTPC